MGGIEKIAAAIGAELLARLPWQNKKQREGLALLIATALQVRSVNLNELAAALPREAERLDMRYQWRFYEALKQKEQAACGQTQARSKMFRGGPAIIGAIAPRACIRWITGIRTMMQ
jgi:hypothetical protein